jgi:hypothetical protein
MMLFFVAMLPPLNNHLLHLVENLNHICDEHLFPIQWLEGCKKCAWLASLELLSSAPEVRQSQLLAELDKAPTFLLRKLTMREIFFAYMNFSGE